jgi:excisionase family DNA binding protein
VTTRKRLLSKDEIKRAFSEGEGQSVPVILTMKEACALLRVARSTLSEWIAKGRLDGAFRKRGKQNLFWRDALVDVIFNSKDWDE